MTEEIQQTRQVATDGTTTTQTTHVREDDRNHEQTTGQETGDTKAVRIVWFIAGVSIAILAIRFLLVLFGANAANGFANFIYSISHPFAAPFFGLFGYSLHYGVSRFELSTLVAMAVYALIAYGVTYLISIKQQPA